MAESYRKPLPHLAQKDIARFWAKVNKNPGQGPHGECWEWGPSRSPDGYGLFYHPTGMFYASRISWFIEHNEDPGILSVLHKCDNPPCVRVSDLFLGTQSDNQQDMVRKGRNRARTRPDSFPRGQDCAKAKLTNATANEALILESQGWTYRAIAKRLDVDESTISALVNGETWKHLERPLRCQTVKRPPIKPRPLTITCKACFLEKPSDRFRQGRRTCLDCLRSYRPPSKTRRYVIECPSCHQSRSVSFSMYNNYHRDESIQCRGCAHRDRFKDS